MGWRAWDRFLVQMEPMLPGVTSFTNDRDAMRAFYCGCTFPDFAQNGINDEAAEFAHWYDFQKAHFDYVKEHYPPPWDAAARRHVAFFFGVLCHGVGDIPWHFDEWGHQAFMNAAWAHDGSSKQIEAAGDVFCHTRYLLNPPLAGQFWWPVDELREVFARAGVEVTLDQLTRGCKTQERDWRKGNTLGRVAYPYAWCAYPWTRRNLVEYYYGGIDNGAAYSAACIGHYYARLQGARSYQNILIQACAFPRQAPFLPCTDTTLDPEDPDNAAGTQPLLRIGPDGTAALLRFDLAEWPSGQSISRATLALYCLERKGRGRPENLPIAAYRVNRPWLEGDAPCAAAPDRRPFAEETTDRHCEERACPAEASPRRRIPERRGNPGLTGSNHTPANSAVDTRAVYGSGATWLSTGLEDAAWDTPGCQGLPADHDADPVAVAIIAPGDKRGHWVQWDITPLARDWAAHPARNLGVLLRACGEAPQTVSFYSSQAARENPSSTRGGRCVAWHPILICWP
jgi:hypothetical protein